MFSAVKTVFSRNPDLKAGEDGNRKVCARKLITKIVNALTASAETGAPMACMYLLNQPDHYTSHTFCPFYWRSYMYEFVGITQQMDYMYRPTKYAQVCLYDWIRLSDKQTMGRAMKRATQKLKPVHEKIAKLENNEDKSKRNIKPLPSRRGGGQDKWKEESDDDDPLLLTKETAQKAREDEQMDAITNYHEPTRFQPTHPQYETHMAVMLPDHCARVPNFVGGTLPHQDMGNREEYCMTMLMLFKPWHKGLDLTDTSQTWDDAFASHEFTERQQEVMKFFHIKYECNDSRDDFSKHRQDKGEHGGLGFEEEEEVDNDDYIDVVQSSVTGDDGAIDYDPEWDVLGRKSLTRIAQMQQAENIAHASVRARGLGTLDSGAGLPREPNGWWSRRDQGGKEDLGVVSKVRSTC
ncbi:uncharacterized protein B0H18DRAFT_938117 [Fomitopsis serialis]|uniref:uncharacterized protein n=1 Tax=Fomitopsis serialis TaxID=139415 RepID=UPI0020080866|nr:uncharacterized protein B0H18DRAFT_938117 [Neoantrodia serialis]KAH9917939.1 hypothetical protein B0H18DRAFT_938117 [Neoantrodia serialis]